MWTRFWTMTHEDENPFVDVSQSVEAERAKTTLLPRRHAKKGKAAPKLKTKRA